MPMPCGARRLRAQVSRAEFMIFVLQELALVDPEQIERILALFDSVDENGDGVLDLKDIRARARLPYYFESCPAAAPCLSAR